jgi:hypothetical protein
VGSYTGHSNLRYSSFQVKIDNSQERILTMIEEGQERDFETIEAILARGSAAINESASSLFW